MRNFRKTAAITAAVMLSAGFAGCGDSSSDSGEHGRLLDTTSEATTQMTVEINTETLAPEQQEQVSALAETLTDKELENKTIKWLSFYDPWHPTGFGNSKPVSVELFEEKYGGEIKYYPTTWANQSSDLSTYVLSGEGIDFFPAIEAIPQYVISGMTESYDDYVDWDSPIWQSVQSLNDQYAVGGKHYLMACQATEGYVVYYNKQTIENMGFEDPAELYANGEWTLEKFREMLLGFVDTDAGQYGLDGWFNCTPLYLASGVPSISLENGKELFYICGAYTLEGSPDIWNPKFGNSEDVMFVPVPKMDDADEYYLPAGLEAYMLCKGAQNPEGVARFMECILAANSDTGSLEIADRKRKDDYGWTDDMIQMRYRINEMTAEHPMYSIHTGCPTDMYNILDSGEYGIRAAFYGHDWPSVRDSLADAVNVLIDEFNESLDSVE